MDRMTLEQIKKSGPEAQELNRQAEAQLAEHKLWLHAQLCVWSEEVGHDDAGLNYLSSLLDAVRDVRLSLVKRELSLREADGRDTVSAVYEYPDVLFEFLTSDKCPKALSAALAGGLMIDSADARQQ